MRRAFRKRAYVSEHILRSTRAKPSGIQDRRNSTSYSEYKRCALYLCLYLRSAAEPSNCRSMSSVYCCNLIPYRHLRWCREGGSNPHDRKGRRILSPPSTSINIVLSMFWSAGPENCGRKCVNFDFLRELAWAPDWITMGIFCIGFWEKAEGLD